MNVLIAEHESSQTVLERLVRKWGYHASTAHDVNGVWSAFYGAEAPSCLILDWMMPNIDGKELCTRIRSRGDTYIYILLLTDAERTQDIVEGLSAGADDYLTRPFDGRELRVRLRVAQRILDLERELATSREMLHTQILRDPETGLWNRSTLHEILEREINRARRERIALSVVLLRPNVPPMDGQTPGGGAAALAKSVAHSVRRCVRSYDDIGRYTEDQILVILPGCDVERAEVVAQRLEAAILNVGPERGPQTAPLKLDLALATLAPGDTLDADALLQRVTVSLA